MNELRALLEREVADALRLSEVIEPEDAAALAVARFLEVLSWDEVRDAVEHAIEKDLAFTAEADATIPEDSWVPWEIYAEVALVAALSVFASDTERV